jgi:peptidoglycan/LPS O-acetylase OafA/YrhL
MVATTKRNLQLDFLRGIAILLVFGRHLEMPRPGGVTGAFADFWFTIGWLGVDLFFVLSGFLIGGLLISEHQKHGSISVGRFLFRRGLKIYPPYFVFLAYLIFMPTIKAIRAGNDGWATFALEWGNYWPNLLFLQNYVGINPAGHTWTLAVEEHFYLALPFALAALVALGWMRYVPVLAASFIPICLGLRMVSVWTNDPFAAKLSASHLRLDALMFGVAVRGIAAYYPDLFARARPWRIQLLAAWLILWLPIVLLNPANFWIRTFGLTGTFLGSAACLLATYQTHAADFGRFAPVITRVASVVAWIGVYSYGIYLWHVTVIGILERVAAQRIFAMVGSAYGVAWLIAAVIVSTGAILVGVVLSKLIEWPVLRFRDRFFPSRSSSVPEQGTQNREPLPSSIPTQVASTA